GANGLYWGRPRSGGRPSGRGGAEGRQSRRWIGCGRVAALIAAGLATGCAELEPAAEPPAPAGGKPAAAPQQQGALPPGNATAVPRPGRKPPAPPLGAPGTAPSPEPAAVPPPGVDPESLRGMRPEEVAFLLGEPWQRAESAPATVWRYVSR